MEYISIDNIFMCHPFRVQLVKFNFTLNTFYQKGIVERDNAIYAVYHVNVALENKLQRGHVEVDLKIYPKLERYCKSTLRRGTILDVFVLVFTIIISKLYIFSVLKLIRLLKVCASYKCLFVCKLTCMAICDWICEKVPFPHILHASKQNDVILYFLY